MLLVRWRFCQLAVEQQNRSFAIRCAVAQNDMLGGGSLFWGANMPLYTVTPPAVILSRAREPSPSAKDLLRCVSVEMSEAYPLMMCNVF